MHLEIQNLSKRYPNGVQALQDVTLSIAPGMFGLLGPNGAGKSTLMRTLATLQDADAGSARLGELNLLRDKDAVRQRLGYLPQEFGLYPRVGAMALLDHFALLKGIGNARQRHELVQALLHKVNLFHARNRPLGTFSGGMKQRFGIAQALIGAPVLIIVDEPTAGLDPEERVRFLNLLAEIGDEVVVILSTHIVGDVADLCPQMAILYGGRVVETGNPVALVAGLAGRIWKKSIAKEELAAEEAQRHVVSVRRSAGRLSIRVHADACPDPSFTAAEADLEDVYFLGIRRASVTAAATATAA